ncbi:MAG: hypothetical protein AAB740_02875 [Patescibacteria group bacterium]
MEEMIITTCPNCRKATAGRRNAGIAIFLCQYCNTIFYSSMGKKIVLREGERRK